MHPKQLSHPFRLRWGLLLTFAFAWTGNALAQASFQILVTPETIVLKNRTFVPDPATSLSVLPPAPAQQSLILQFNEELKPSELSAMGIACEGKISATAIYTRLAAGTDLTTIPKLRWAGKLQAGDKMSIAATEKFDGKPGQNQKMVVEFLDGLGQSQIDQLISNSGASSISYGFLEDHSRLVDGTEAAFQLLEGKEEVSWIRPASPGMEAGRPVFTCEGMMTDGCHTAPFASEIPNSASQRWVTNGNGWDGPGNGCVTIRYFLGAGTADVAGEGAEVVRAMNTWADVAGLTFNPTTIAGLPGSIDVFWTSIFNHGDGRPFVSTTGAHAFGPSDVTSEPRAGDLHFNDFPTWAIYSGTGEPNQFRLDVYSVALHEIGHSLGLEHSENEASVMHKDIELGQVFSGLHPDDIQGIRALYAPDINAWEHGWPDVHWDTDLFNVAGDIEVAPNGQVRHRSPSGKMVNKYWNNTSGWNSGMIAPNWNGTNEDVAPGSAIAIAPNGETFYAGLDGQLHSYTYSGGWSHNWIVPDFTQTSHLVVGEIEVAPNGQVRYHAKNGKIANMYRPGGVWARGYLAPNWTTDQEDVAENGAIAIGPDGQTFYHGKDGRLQNFHYSGGWNHGWVGPNWGSDAWNVKGDIEVSDGAQIYYHGIDDQLQTYFRANGTWNHAWVFNTPGSVWDVDGDIEVAPNGQVRYRRTDGKIVNVYGPQGSESRGLLTPNWLEASWDMIAGGQMDIGPDGQTYYHGIDNKLQNYHYVNYCSGKTNGQPVAENEELSEQPGAFKLASFPNPFQDNITFELLAPKDGKFSLSIVDLQGRNAIQILDNQMLSSGKHTIKAQTRHLTAGMYFAVLTTSDQKRSYKIVKTGSN